MKMLKFFEIHHFQKPIVPSNEVIMLSDDDDDIVFEGAVLNGVPTSEHFLSSVIRSKL